MLIGIDEEVAAAARTTLPLLSVAADAVVVDRGIALMVATRGMRLESDADLLGETVRLTLGLEDGIALAATVLTDREGVCTAIAAGPVLEPSAALAALRASCVDAKVEKDARGL